MSSAVRRIAIAALLASFGIMAFEAQVLIADAQGAGSSEAAQNFQARRDVQVAQNSSAAARSVAGKPAAPAAEGRLQPRPAAHIAQAQPTPPQPQQEAPAPRIPIRTEILRFDGWIVTCNEFEGGAKTRVCSALLQITQEKTNQTVFSWTVGQNNNKQWISVLQTPTGVAIAPGVELRIGKSPARKIPFTTCETGHCVATMTMDANLLHEMTTSPTAQAVIQGAQGNAVNFSIQMAGFDKAYAVMSHP